MRAIGDTASSIEDSLQIVADKLQQQDDQTITNWLDQEAQNLKALGQRPHPTFGTGTAMRTASSGQHCNQLARRERTASEHGDDRPGGTCQTDVSHAQCGSMCELLQNKWRYSRFSIVSSGSPWK